MGKRLRREKKLVCEIENWHVLCSDIEPEEARRTPVRTVWVIQHIDCETPGTITDALQAEAISLQTVSSYKGEPVPKEMGVGAGLVIMGGPMGVYEQDRYPFLRAELRLIEQALREQKPVLGICLGSQLLAAALGAKVTKGKRKEIGWHAITLSEAAGFDPLWKGVESPFAAYHWHGDVFELPRGAAALASSVLTPCQAFRYGDCAYGFLFHMEVTQEIIDAMVQTFAEELRQEGINGREITALAQDHLPSLQGVGKVVFHRWASLVGAPPISSA